MANGTGPETVDCRSCGTEIRKHTEICHHCGVENEQKPGHTTTLSKAESGTVDSDTLIGDAIEYPSRGNDPVVSIVIGGLLSALSILLVPIIVLFGYFVAVLERTSKNDDYPPKFENWGRLASRGVQGFLITVAYYLVPLVVLAVFGGIGGALGGGDIGVGLGLIVATILFAVFTYIYPAAITNFAYHDAMGKAFDFEDISTVVLTGEYLAAWIIGVVIFAVVGVIVTVLGLVPIVGIFLGLFVSFYAQVAAYRVFGLAYRRSAIEQS